MDRVEGLRRLAEQGWLARQSPGFRAALLPLARWHRIARGQYLTLAGEEADDLIGLAAGTVAFTATLGRPETPIMHMAPAVFWMGYRPLLLDDTRIVTAEARTDVWIASFPKEKLLPLIDARPGGWRPFMALMSEFGDICSVIAADLLIQHSGRRCAAVLLRFAGARQPGPRDGAPMLVPVTQEQLAAAANLSRNSVGGLLRSFAAAHLIRTTYGGIEILDAPGLRLELQAP